MPSFICEHCQHVFSLKTDLDRHLKRKNACIPIAQLQQQQQLMQEQEANRYGGVQEISGVFKSCLDILRNDGGHLVGDEALPELSRMIIYKQMEKLIDDGHIDLTQIKNHDAVVAKWGTKYEQNIGLAKFSNLLAYINESPENMLNLKKIMNEFLWKTIGSNHPKLNCVFPEDGKFAIKTPQTFKDLMTTLNRVDFNKYDFDILGEAYERLFVDAIFGAGGNKKSELGQYFTPRNVIQFMINEINPKMKENGQIESFADFSCGTGGILITAINHYKKLAKQSSITEEMLKEQFKQKLFGIEIKDKLFNLCAANILLHTGEVLENIVLGDSIRKYWNIKVDKIGANPPFSVKIDYDSLFIQRNDNEGLHTHMNDVMPIRVGGKNSESLFLQMMIHSLNIGGECATVMLDGQKMDNSSAGNSEVREYLMKSCSLDAVIYCPGGTFTSTGSKTVILKFTKKKERADVVEPRGQGNKRTYKFTKTHATKSVKFYDYRPDIEGNKFLLGEVPIEKIAAKNYSLRLQDYDEEDEQDEMEGVQFMRLGDVCEIDKSFPKHSTDYGVSEGNFPFYTGGKNTKLFVDNYDIEDLCIIQNRTNGSGKCNIVLSKRFSAAKQTLVYKAKQGDLTTKYIYEYFKNNIEILERGYKGCNHKNFSSDYLKNLQIPIPSLAMQQKFIDYCERIERINQQTKQQIEVLKKLKDNHLEMCRMKFPTNNQDIMKKLEDVCYLRNGTQLDKKEIEDGEYPVYGGGVKIVGYCDKFNRMGNETIICGTGAKAGYVTFNNFQKFWASQCFTIETKNQTIISDVYLFKFCKTCLESIFQEAKKGAAIPYIRASQFTNINIPVPSNQEQQSIVEFCENMQKKIKQKEQLIEQLQEIVDSSTEDANAYLNLILQNQTSSIPQEIEEQEVATEATGDATENTEEVEEHSGDSVEEDADEIMGMASAILNEPKKKKNTSSTTQKRKKKNVVTKYA